MVFDFLTESETMDQETAATPTLSNVLQRSIQSAMEQLQVCMPAEVVSYDKDKQLASCQPMFKNKYRDGATLDMPVIYNVPVAHPRSGTAIVHMPIKKGDRVLLVFSDRSLEKWLTSGERSDPEDNRKHQMSDAIAYPGLYPMNEAKPIANGEDIIFLNEGKNGKLEMRLTPSNKIQVLNNSNEMVKILYDLIVAIQEAKVYTSTGAQPLRHSKFTSLTNKLKTFVKV